MSQLRYILGGNDDAEGKGGQLLWDGVARLIAAINIVIVVITIQGRYWKRIAG